MNKKNIKYKQTPEELAEEILRTGTKEARVYTEEEMKKLIEKLENENVKSSLKSYKDKLEKKYDDIMKTIEELEMELAKIKRHISKTNILIEF